MIFWLVVSVVLIALIFDFINGFHDTANAVATVISTGVLPARTAIIMAAALNFVGAFWSIKVADTIAKMVNLHNDVALTAFDLYHINPVTGALLLILAGLIAAIFWNLLTWYVGLPSSSSHALLGGVVGAAGLTLGSSVVKLEKVYETLRMLVLSPVAGLIIAFFVMVAISWISRNWRPKTAHSSFRWLQLLSSAMMAFSHGTNDAQKSMGIIWMVLLAAAPTWLANGKDLPLWAIASCAIAMGLGTAVGGQRIIRTMGHKIIALEPIHGFAAETTAAIVLQGTAYMGVPVSTTHVISGAIMGVGASKRFSAVRWGVAGNIVTAWFLTIPVCMALGGGLAYLFLHVAAN
jgi:PiT family inorganic phosphate transporter